jgi:hypothetical protein
MVTLGIDECRIGIRSRPVRAISVPPLKNSTALKADLIETQFQAAALKFIGGH